MFCWKLHNALNRKLLICPRLFGEGIMMSPFDGFYLTCFIHFNCVLLNFIAPECLKVSHVELTWKPWPFKMPHERSGGRVTWVNILICSSRYHFPFFSVLIYIYFMWHFGLHCSWCSLFFFLWKRWYIHWSVGAHGL